MLPIYLDYNATTPIDPEVAEAMAPYLAKYFGNPSSGHWYGQNTRRALELARRQVAHLLGCVPDEIFFTSGGSEANNFALKGFAWANHAKGDHIITSAIEHSAILEACRFLERQGFRLSLLPVDEFGRVRPAALREVITPQTILVSVMHANNEVGTLQAITEIVEIAHAAGIAVHCDAAQSLGKVPVRVDQLGVDLLSVAGHKLYAPIGVGALFVRRGLKLEPLIHGAAQEQQRRAGTENVLEIAGLGKACEIAGRDLEKNIAHMKTMRERLRAGLRSSELNVRFNGHPEHVLPNTLSVSFRGVQASALLSEISNEVVASAGAACHAETARISHVLQAMHVPPDYALGTIRFSTGRKTTALEIDRTLTVLKYAVKKLQQA
ncbi:MAG: cysteine desulfurase family protein [bacterium]